MSLPACVPGVENLWGGRGSCQLLEPPLVQVTSSKGRPQSMGSLSQANTGTYELFDLADSGAEGQVCHMLVTSLDYAGVSYCKAVRRSFTGTQFLRRVCSWGSWRHPGFAASGIMLAVDPSRVPDFPALRRASST